MTTNQFIKYRSLEELINTCSVDLRAIYSDGVIETAELIKVVQKCNYKLGIQINQTKETILDVEHFRTKLPNDFQFLNFALLCSHHTVVSELWPEGLVKQESILPVTFSSTINLTSCPCWTVVNATGRDIPTTYTGCDGFNYNVIFSSGTTQLCANMVVNPNQQLTISTSSMCYNNPNDGSYTCNAVINCGCESIVEPCSAQPNPDPWMQNKVRTICNGAVDIAIEQICQHEVRHYHNFEKLFIQPNRQASAFSSNDQFRTAGNIAYICNQYLELGRECCKVYMNYQGLLEDKHGNLMVLDHPLINEFYEIAVKERILFNLYINGEPDLERRHKAMETKLIRAEHEAMEVAYTPDWQVVVQTYRSLRKHENEKHFAPFDRFFGPFQTSAWLDSFVNSRYRQ